MGVGLVGNGRHEGKGGEGVGCGEMGWSGPLYCELTLCICLRP